MASRPRRRALRLAATLVALSAWGCADGPAAAGPDGTTRIVLDARALLTADGGPVSVIALARLDVTFAGGTLTSEDSLDVENPVVEFELTLPDGPASFDASIVSNNGSVLFRGVREEVIASDGFQVVVDLTAQAPVLVASPDSQRVAAPGSPPRPFLLENRGTDVLEWFVESVSPDLDACGVHACLRVEPLGGSVGPGSQGTLRVTALNTPAGAYRIRLASAEGHVELVAATDAVSPAGVIGAFVDDPAGSPVSGRAVTLRACSPGSEEGSPGTCVPDESSVPVTDTTASSGVVRFGGLPDGYWEVRPDPSGLEAVSPPATTVRLDPGETRQTRFTAYPIG